MFLWFELDFEEQRLQLLKWLNNFSLISLVLECLPADKTKNLHPPSTSSSIHILVPSPRPRAGPRYIQMHPLHMGLNLTLDLLWDLSKVTLDLRKRTTQKFWKMLGMYLLIKKNILQDLVKETVLKPLWNLSTVL